MNISDFAGKIRDIDAERDKFFRETVDELAGRMLSKARKLTPVRTGELRRRWSAKPTQRDGKRYRAIVINNVRYASYVEYGHRQNVGQFVPAIGKRLVNPWVEGAHMLRLAHNDVNRQAEAIIRRRFRAFLKGHLP